jgi:outer membrane protein
VILGEIGTRGRIRIAALLAILATTTPCVSAQCQGKVATLASVANCTARVNLPATELKIDPAHPFRLEELIDLAERNNPETRMAWESARQAAERMGIERSAYYPHLAALALFGDQRLINPFPKILSPNGYNMVEIPVAQAGLGLEYDVFDFGRRGARLESSKALRLASAAAFQRSNQDVAFHVVTAYYDLLTEQERLDATRQILKTAETTQQAAEAQLAQGRATLPDVLNAKAASAQAAYDLEASVGAETEARVALREAIGVEPSDEIAVEAPADASLPRRRSWWSWRCKTAPTLRISPSDFTPPTRSSARLAPRTGLAFISMLRRHRARSGRRWTTVPWAMPTRRSGT